MPGVRGHVMPPEFGYPRSETYTRVLSGRFCKKFVGASTQIDGSPTLGVSDDVLQSSERRYASEGTKAPISNSDH